MSCEWGSALAFPWQQSVPLYQQRCRGNNAGKTLELEGGWEGTRVPRPTSNLEPRGKMQSEVDKGVKDISQVGLMKLTSHCLQYFLFSQMFICYLGMMRSAWLVSS